MSPFEQGDIVGLRRDGPVTKYGQRSLVLSRNTSGACLLAVISRQAIVSGNAPDDAERCKYDEIAYIGRVLVKVDESVQLQAQIYASGQNDCVGTAQSHAGDERFVGWVSSCSDENDTRMVEIMVKNFASAAAVSTLQALVASNTPTMSNCPFVGREREMDTLKR
jgi:hypothetical protein